MADDSFPSPPTNDTPPPRTTGGGFRWEPPTAEELQNLMPGYTIEKILGRGGMGAVYRGVQTNLDRPVAIKILPPGVEKEDPSFAERFKNEAKLMAKLNHPGVVAVHDFGTTLGGQLYFAMEYVDGSDVSQMIRTQGRLPPEHALAITAHVCDALQAAHELGIVHRDIKPANVLINMKGQVKVADFGLAKIEDPGQHGLTKTGYAMGTPDFVAPEALTLGTGVDGRADLYAVGVMLYQMLTGNIPRGAFKPASVLVPGLDPRFDSIIIKAMQHDRAERHQNAAELRSELDVILTVPLVQHNAPASAAIPVAQMAQTPAQRSAVAQKPQPFKGGAGTPARNQTPGGAAAKMNEADKSVRAPLPPPKSKAPLFIGIGAIAAIGIGAFVMFGGGKPANKPAAPPAAPVADASPGARAKKNVATPSPKPASTPAVAVEAPVIPASVASRLPGQELPPGNWVKAIANAKELPDALRVQGVTFKDGWIVPSRPVVWVIIPGVGWKAMGVRFRTRVADGHVAAPLLRRHGTVDAEGNAYRFDITPAAAQIQWVDPDIAQPQSLLRYASPMPPMRDGTEHAVEFAVSGDLWVGRMDEVFLAQNLERKIGSGGVAIMLHSPVRDVEVINFNIFSPNTAREILGVNNDGEDLRGSGTQAVTAARSTAAPAPVPASPKSASAATPPSSSPNLPVSKSSDPKFPPGKWVKVFTKFDDIPAFHRKDGTLAWNDGWLDGQKATNTPLIAIPDVTARNIGLRLKVKLQEANAADFVASLSLRRAEAADGKRLRYTLVLGRNPKELRLTRSTESGGGSVQQEMLWRSAEIADLKEGVEHTMEFSVIGSRLFVRWDGGAAQQVSDDKLVGGGLAIQNRHLIRDIEVINLDGLPEAEALKILGADEKGNDLRQPSTVASATPAASSPTPSASKSSDPKFPPGQWVKVFTKFEDLPEALIKPDSGVKFEDGAIVASKMTSLFFGPEVSWIRNGGWRATINSSAGFEMRVRDNTVPADKFYALNRSRLAYGERRDGKIVHTTLKPVPPSSTSSAQRWEFVATGSLITARCDGALIGTVRDDRIANGKPGLLNFTGTIRDIEVINLDGLPEAEALRILGVDEKGNDLRALAAKQEQQKAEMAKQADAMAAIPELKTLHEQFVKLQAERVTAPFEAEVAKLNAGYVGGIDREIANEKKAGHLDGVIALEAEKKLIQGMGDSVPQGSGGTAAQPRSESPAPCPIPAEDDEKTTDALKKLRGIYRAAYAKLEATRAENLKALTDPLSVRLKQLETDLTKKDRVDHAKQVKAYRENLGKANPAENADISARTAPASNALTTTKDAGDRSASTLPSGVLHGAGVFQDIPLDLSKFGNLNGFVQVTCGANSWAALRADGSVISSHPKINGLKDIVSVNYASQGLAVIPQSRKGITVAWAGGALTAVEIDAASYGGGRVMDVALAGQNNLIVLKDDRTIRLIGPSFPVSKTLQETKAITDVVGITSGGGWLAALDARGKVHAWTWWTPNSDVHEGPARSIDVSDVPADASHLFAMGTMELRIASRSGTWKIHTFGPDCTFEAKVDRPLPEHWQRFRSNIVLCSDGSWTTLQPLSADIAALAPKGRKVLDMCVVTATVAQNNAKTAMALWIEPPENAP